MRLRSSVLAGILFLAPAFGQQLGIDLPFAPSEAHAQTAKERARELFIEGVNAFDGSQFEDARTAFLQAYALTRHPAVLLNLGQSELKSGHVEEGGNHLQQFLREHRTATAAQKASAKNGVSEARRKTGFVIVIVDTDGAALGIDGQPIGNAPLLDPYFVKAAKHQASATLGGKTVRVDFTAKRGTATPVQLNLRGGSPGVVVAPVPAAPAPVATGPAAVPSAVPYQPVGPTPIPGPALDGPDGDTSGRPDFLDWGASEPVFWGGAGLAGANVLAAIIFGAAAADANSSAETVSQKILEEVEARNNLPAEYISASGQPQPCGEFDNESSAFEYYADACQQLRDNIDAYDLDIALMATGIVVGVLAAGGTVGYYFYDTADAADETAKRTGSFTVAPILSPDQKGFGVVGTF